MKNPLRLKKYRQSVPKRLLRPEHRVVRAFANKHHTKKKILNETKKKSDVIYGARSIQAQIGIFARPTQDYDIYTKNPKKSAMKMEKKLDKQIGFDYFYHKPAQYPGTHKVRNRGFDMRKGTRDDEDVIDYSKFPKPKPKTVNVFGVSYRDLSGEKKAKINSLKDPMFKFRHEKDRDDLNRIKMFQEANRKPSMSFKMKLPRIKFNI